MTLSKQLIVLIATLLLVVFAGTFLISVQNTRAYLQNQLESHAQDAATSLGLSISSHLGDGDLAVVTSMTDAIFGRGFYRMVRVEDMQGKPLVDRILPVRIDGVPDWFIERLPLVTPVGEAVVMSGWVQAGVVKVRSHPGYAYDQLWKNAEETFWWFVSSAAMMLLAGIALLHWVMKPLKDVEWQANSICNREFPVIEPLPRTLDLRRIVEAMNRMSAKVRRMLDELESLAAGLRRQAHEHPVTGLANKARFMATLDELTASPEECATGVLALVQLKAFKQFNERHGYQAGDELLVALGSALTEVSRAYPACQLAHLSGADFGLFVQNAAIDEMEPLAVRLSSALAGQYAEGKPLDRDVGHVGLAFYNGRQRPGELFAEADMALRAAQGKGANGWQLSTPETMDRRQIRGAMQWRAFIEQSLAENRLVLQFQPVFDCRRTLLHHEVLVRIAEEGKKELMSAGVFMPQAESAGMTMAIDQVVIHKVLTRLSLDEPDTRYAVNIAPSTLRAPEFSVWLEGQLEEFSGVAGRIVFEMPEYGAVAMLDRVRELIELLERFGSQFSIDHFGRSVSSFAYLRSVKAHYLKIDGSYMRGLDQERDNRFFVQALAEIAHGLEIRVIGESIESEAVWELLPQLNLDGGQGYYLGRPRHGKSTLRQNSHYVAWRYASFSKYRIPPGY
ncbi:MAG: EAL domain-containing protein, partial [gamma proteobacterium symbiont of Phacoides pectinatus]